MPSRKADPFRWDTLVRLTHWSLAAACISNLWLNEAGEEWHEWLGYLAMTAIGLRLLWGLTLAKGYARLCALIPRGEDFHRQAREIGERLPATPGHHGTGKLAVWALWFTVLATGFTGWFQNTELGFGWGADEWHIWCTWALQGLIGLHLTALLLTSWRQRSNLLGRMLPGRGVSVASPVPQDQQSLH